jgi:hypothetical protein
MIRHCLYNRLTGGGEVASLMHLPRSAPETFLFVSGTHSPWSMNKTQDLVNSKMSMTSSGLEPSTSGL